MFEHLNSVDKTILAFFLGLLSAKFFKKLNINKSLSFAFSIYLLFFIGYKGGQHIQQMNNFHGFFEVLIVGLSSCFLIPIFIFFVLKNKVNITNASALAACYGSVSAVTFMAATNFLENNQIFSSGFMVAVMALMEIPAIIMALFLLHTFKNDKKNFDPKVIKEVFTNKSITFLIAGFFFGTIAPPEWHKMNQFLTKDLFRVILAFFLFDLGIKAFRHIDYVKKHKFLAAVVGVLFPLIAGTLSLMFSHFLKIPIGDAIMISVLTGSASYIAAPAAIRIAAPDAIVSMYISFPLVMTFSFNILFGIPYYLMLAKMLY